MAEAIIITLLASKLDPATRRSWEASIEHGKLPDYTKTIKFLRNHCHVLERCENAVLSSKAKGMSANVKPTSGASKKLHVAAVQKTDGCLLCSGSHTLDVCETFKKLNVNDRYAKAKQLGICFGCLKKGHRTANCKKGNTCATCSKNHHYLLHQEEKKPTVVPAEPIGQSEAISTNDPVTVAKCSVSLKSEASVKQILLATAIVNVYDLFGNVHKCRVLLDSGAMADFISERMVDLLKLHKESANIPIVGVNGMKTTVKFKVNANVSSRTTGYKFCLDCLIVPRVTGALPALRIDPEGWPIPHNIQLADPMFHEPSRIDMLIGAGKFFDMIQSGKITMSTNLPILQESQLGWLVAGPVVDPMPFGTVKVCQSGSPPESNEKLYELLRRFWSIDDQSQLMINNEDECEKHFLRSYRRQPDGRFIVEIPFQDNLSKLGESRMQAQKRFEALERRLKRHPEMKTMYIDFINEYLHLGHCRVVQTDEKASVAFYLPHHCVIKPDSSTTKLRVVFDASAKSTSALSLNDVMMVGPNVQDSLFNIILRFRMYKFVFTADVSKMYRQILVYEPQRKYQRILWRENETDDLTELELNTVTYGTAAAPFLATRTILQLAKDEENRFPSASKAVVKSFYVDDVLTGADTLEHAQQLKTDLIDLLGRGGFELHKWCANNEEIIADIPIETREKHLKFEDNDINGVIKTLGILWNPAEDNFLFHVQPINENDECPTKRMILSETAKIFDPLGLLAPTVVIAKLLMQHLWKERLDWDDKISDEQFRIWSRFRSELNSVNNIRIDRRLTMDAAETTELHGFADASLVAYGCCLYLRSVDGVGNARVRLICAKSKVTPLKQTQRETDAADKLEDMTVPRLELCAATLLVEQMNIVRETIAVSLSKVVLWSDSKIVLCWLKNMKQETPVFVKNRVLKIRQLSQNVEWRHVSTKMNPADLVSRGMFPSELKNSDLWWTGPAFLRTVGGLDIENSVESSDAFDDESVPTVTLAVKENRLYDVIAAKSNLRKLQRIFAYMNRFIFNCRSKQNQVDRRSGILTSIEHNAALRTIVTVVQQVVYPEEIISLQCGKRLKGKLANLNPVYDDNSRLLRVGGRIRHSDLPLAQRHPIILPEKNHFTEMLIDCLHRENLHVGLTGLMAIVRQMFWPVNAKRTINRVLRKCVTCFKNNPTDIKQFMGDLPSCRVTAALPFARTGIDYAGPFLIKAGRMKAKIKAYICLFICMTTKAIHLELVTSLSTDAFLACLHRFVSRRGNPSELFSDNGTNFRGADRQLKELFDLLKCQVLKGRVLEFCQSRGISWSFNPPKAPHQGGLWEANIKCVKSHLNRVLNESYLTYEEMHTLLVQIEGILNSRPLVQLSDDPKDYEALSPAHFLVGRELTAVAEPLYEDLKENTLSRYQLVQKRKQCFWRRWSNEYVTNLQRRGKWFKDPTMLQKGLLVILKEDNTLPKHWKMGRIEEVYPGKDGIIRVVSVRTNNGVYRRPTTQLAVLPVNEEIQPNQEKA
ncbi:uncharacterized protein LOC134206062 [Armigeres subalbatus]|uniref:uncharacterized protein LOC134206062 n=1 Tax=Armigeres subalbatus TaxID=124917 RepID=UPI002ED4FDFE